MPSTSAAGQQGRGSSGGNGRGRRRRWDPAPEHLDRGTGRGSWVSARCGACCTLRAPLVCCNNTAPNPPTHSAAARPGPAASAEAAAEAGAPAAISSTSGGGEEGFTPFLDNDYSLEVPAAYTYYETPIAVVGGSRRGVSTARACGKAAPVVAAAAVGLTDPSV
jgi:hypothetical protein